MTLARQPDRLARIWTLRFDGKTIRQRNSSFARWTRAALARDTHVFARRRRNAGDRPPLWPRRFLAAPVAPVLVPVVWRGHGNGLAFVRHHDQRHRRSQARAGAAFRRTRHPRLRRPRPALAEDTGRIAGPRRTHRF